MSSSNAFYAGCISGMAGVVVGQPFDTSKVILQVGGPGEAQLQKSIRGRVRRLYRGIGPPLVTSGVIRALNFGLWQNCLDHLNRRDNVDTKTPRGGAVFVSGCFASAITAPLTQVVHVLKLQRQVHGTGTSYASFFGRNLWSPGFVVHTSLEALGSGVYYTSYVMSKYYATPRSDETPFLTRLLCGSFAGVCGWCAIFPLDTLRSRILSSPRGQPLRGIDVARDIVREHGVRGFYHGIGPCLMRAVPVAATVLPTYDYVLSYLQNRE
jgi:solute carrier family 25 (mitochondrial carnitine/acylcarnitine transporter), member 20/29